MTGEKIYGIASISMLVFSWYCPKEQIAGFIGLAIFCAINEARCHIVRVIEERKQ